MSTSLEKLLFICAGSTVAPVIMEASSPLTKGKGKPASKVIQVVRQSFFGREITVDYAVFDLFLVSVEYAFLLSYATQR